MSALIQLLSEMAKPFFKCARFSGPDAGVPVLSHNRTDSRC